MEIRKIRDEMRAGRVIYDLPLRVTFYARVSTDMDAQLNSLENQVQYYTDLIRSKSNWTFVPGYIDEGISGTSTKNRDAFNRMIREGKAGKFDFIITKEISRFSRSTLDSIQYTQELLEHNIGVYFQNDNINTLDSDSEFRLVIIAGMAQDEVRRMSERLRFGFRQAIKKGHVLGSDNLYGYDKKDCVLTINKAEAKIVRTVFELYANEGLGTRKISQRLLEMGFTSRRGNAFNTLTIRHMIENPKYKGWYCGQKSQSLDYRTKKKQFLDESEWVMYPDPSIPAIVPEELWNRANALYKERSKQMKAYANSSSYHNRYPYSCKIWCEEHGTTYHRQILSSKKGDREVWQCKVYRSRGKVGCSSPQLRSSDLDQIMSLIFQELMTDKQLIIDSLMTVLTALPRKMDDQEEIRELEAEIGQMRKKKDRLLDLSLAGAISAEEFKTRNDEFNARIAAVELQITSIREKERKYVNEGVDEQGIRCALEREMCFEYGINSALVATILEKIVVKKGSIKNNNQLDIILKMGQKYEVNYASEKSSARIIQLIRVDAEGHRLWKTEGEIVSVYYGRTANIRWTAVMV